MTGGGSNVPRAVLSGASVLVAALLAFVLDGVPQVVAIAALTGAAGWLLARRATVVGSSTGGQAPATSAPRDVLRRLVELQADFFDEPDTARVMPRVLRDLLALTESQFAMIGEVRHSSAGRPYFELLDSHHVSWADSPHRAQEGTRARASDLGPLIDYVIAAGVTLDGEAPPEALVVPASLQARRPLVLPIMLGEALMGVAVVGDRAPRPAAALADAIAPYLAVCGGLLRWSQYQERHRRLEDDLKSREDLYRDLFDSASDLIHSVRPDGGFAYVNKAWRETLGYSEQEVERLVVADVVHEADRDFYRTVFALAAPGSPPESREMVFVAKDGRHIAVEGAEGCRFVDGVPAVTRAIFRDVTRRKQEEDALRRAMTAAEEAAHAKGYFLANMSHELRTPMNAVIGMTEFLRDTPLTREQGELVGTIQRAGESLLDIINNILDFSKIESGKLELERAPFRLRDAVEHAVDLVAATAAGKGLDLAYFLAPDTSETVIGDVTRFRQVLVNLLSNAVKFTRKGEVVVTIEGHPVDEDYELYVRVRDTGVGIPEDRIDRLFHSFSQVDASTTRQFGGTGLGLALCKRLTECMGGSIWVESRPGLGSIFHFTVLTHLPPATAVPAPPPTQLAGTRVAVIAQSPTTRRLLLDQTSAWGMVPSAAVTVEQVPSDAAQGAGIDLAIIDAQTSLTDAIVMATELQARTPDRQLPFVFLAGLGQPEEAIEGLERLVWLSKPIKHQNLLASLQRALDPASARTAPPPTPATAVERASLAILLAEDNIINQQVATRMLDRLGYSADIANNGREALDAMKASHYDLLLLDVQMPEVDGFEVARQLKASGDEPPFIGEPPYVVGMTALALPADRERCLAAGMDDYISKPIRPEALREAIDRMFALRSGRAARTPEPLSLAPPPPASLDRREPGTIELVDRRSIATLRALDDDSGTDFAAQLIDRLGRELPTRLASMEAAAARGDASLVEQLAHTLKSSCGTIGAMAMAEVCQRIETSASHGDLAPVTGWLAELRAVATSTQPVLDAYRIPFPKSA